MQNEFEIIDQPDATRSIALKLHALHEDDRAWLLTQLDSEARSQLLPLLEELVSLGVQLDRADIEHVTAGSGSSEKFASHTKETALINRASLSQIDIVFDGEPSILRQQLTVLHPWSWMAETLGRANILNVTRAGAIHNSEATPAVKHALLKIVAIQLQKQDAVFDVPGNYRTLDYLAKPSSSMKDRLRGLLPWAR